MRNRLRSLLALGFIVFLSQACDPLSSNDIPTELLAPEITAVAEGDGTTLIEASLYDPFIPTNLVTLEAGDEFIAYADNMQQTLEPDMFQATLASTVWPSDEETDFRIAFERAGEVDAPDNLFTLPPPFEILEPAPGTTVPRTSGFLEVTWDQNPSGFDWMELEITGSCIRELFKPFFVDWGLFRIPAVWLYHPAHQGECDITVKLSRFRFGRTDRAFFPGHIIAKQVRTLTLHSVR